MKYGISAAVLLTAFGAEATALEPNKGFQLSSPVAHDVISTAIKTDPVGTCGAAYSCSGGGGDCGASYNCSGGGGQCGASYNCAGQ